MRVGFIGLGAMGTRMAGRLLAAHHDVVVYNRTPERTRPLEQRGAKVAATPKQLAAGVDIVFSSVANDAALEQVMFGPDGALAGTRAGATVIEMSTVNPRTSRQVHEAARSNGVSVLDAPLLRLHRDLRRGRGGRVSEVPADPRRAGQQDEDRLALLIHVLL